jgi:cob(I)alamin adenosyltransferase
LAVKKIRMKRKNHSMIHLYMGDGKGKTTAAIGLAVRAAGCGIPVIFSQFMKGNDTGELHSLEQLAQVKICRSPRNFGFYSAMSDEDKRALTGIHNAMLDSLCEAARAGSCGLIVLDEITYPVKWGLLDTDKLKELLVCSGPELVLTGRDPADFLREAADYITEMRCVRHPFEKGVKARRGIEY